MPQSSQSSKNKYVQVHLWRFSDLFQEGQDTDQDRVPLQLRNLFLFLLTGFLPNFFSVLSTLCSSPRGRHNP